MLTTIDNPFSPFLDYDNWLSFDESKGYNTNQILARNCLVLNDLTEQQQEEEIESAIDFIVGSGLYPLHVKIEEKDEIKIDNERIEKAFKILRQ